MTSMTARTFVDTNVWVYAVDAADPAKRERARQVLTPEPNVELVVSSQVLGEFYVTVTRKLARPLGEGEAARMIDELRRLPCVALDADHVAAAIDGSVSWGISYWDALVIEAARSAGCRVVLSEDLADGQTYGDVGVENPFGRQRRVSESPAQGMYGRVEVMTDEQLRDALARYEREAQDAGMTRNSVHSYWDYARRFLDWRTGEYRPRGATGTGRPVPPGAVSTDELFGQVGRYGQAIEAAGRQQDTIGTYVRHAMFFVRWLRGDFQPGSRLR